MIFKEGVLNIEIIGSLYFNFKGLVILNIHNFMTKKTHLFCFLSSFIFSDFHKIIEYVKLLDFVMFSTKNYKVSSSDNIDELEKPNQTKKKYHLFILV